MVKVAIVGGESLLGRELRDLLASSILAPRVTLLGEVEEGAGILTERGGEPVFLGGLDKESLADAGVVFLAGSAISSRMAFDLAAKAPFIDLSFALETEPGARLRAPQVELPDKAAARGGLHVIAHPAAISLMLFFDRLAKEHRIARSVVQVFEPASERGQRGITELQQQTASLLSFKKLPQEVFDAQLAFNLLPKYGEDAQVSLEEIEKRIDRHFAALLGKVPMPPPSLRLVQAPVFHGYSFSVWIEFDDKATIPALAKTLKSPLVEVRNGSEEPPSNAGAAGHSGITVGAITPDRNNSGAFWFWAVADNVRIAADNAVAVAGSLLRHP